MITISNEIYKDDINRIINGKSSKDRIPIMYQIVNVDDQLFFAREISTGAIFPTYGFVVKDGAGLFHTYSFLNFGYNFVFMDLDGNGLNKFSLSSSYGNKYKVSNIEEINRYLDGAGKRFKRKIIELENENKFLCPLSEIKDKIAQAQTQDMTYSKGPYVSLYNTSKISDMGYDLATRSDLCHVIGRDIEIAKLIKDITIKKDSVLILGDAGSGKTVLVEELARQIREQINPWLQDKMIFYLNLSSVVANTKYRGEFSIRLKEVIDFCTENSGEVILFIDEIHSLYGLGRTEETTISAMDILKPYIESGEILIIGATTKREYQEHLMKDPAFCDRFDKIVISPLTLDLNIEILIHYIKELAEKFSVSLDFEDELIFVIKDLLEATDIKHQRSLLDVPLSNPRLAKRVIRDAFAEVVYQKRNVLTIYDIKQALVNCDNLSSTIREKIARELKENLNREKEIRNNIIDFPGRRQ